MSQLSSEIRRGSPALLEDERGEPRLFLHYALIAMLVERPLRKAGADLEKLEPFSRGLAKLARRPLNLLRMPFAIWRLKHFDKKYAKNFEQRDIILSPTTTTPAPKLGHLSPALDFDTHLERLMSTVAFTPLQNASGGPRCRSPEGARRTACRSGCSWPRAWGRSGA